MLSHISIKENSRCHLSALCQLLEHTWWQQTCHIDKMLNVSVCILHIFNVNSDLYVYVYALSDFELWISCDYNIKLLYKWDDSALPCFRFSHFPIIKICLKFKLTTVQSLTKAVVSPKFHRARLWSVPPAAGLVELIMPVLDNDCDWTRSTAVSFRSGFLHSAMNTHRADVAGWS